MQCHLLSYMKIGNPASPGRLRLLDHQHHLFGEEVVAGIEAAGLTGGQRADLNGTLLPDASHGG